MVLKNIGRLAFATLVFTTTVNGYFDSDSLKKWIEGVVSSPEFQRNSKGNSGDYHRIDANSGNEDRKSVV